MKAHPSLEDKAWMHCITAYRHLLIGKRLIEKKVFFCALNNAYGTPHPSNLNFEIIPTLFSSLNFRNGASLDLCANQIFRQTGLTEDAKEELQARCDLRARELSEKKREEKNVLEPGHANNPNITSLLYSLALNQNNVSLSILLLTTLSSILPNDVSHIFMDYTGTVFGFFDENIHNRPREENFLIHRKLI